MKKLIFEILFILIITIYFIRKLKVKEDFITWYLPFYNKGTKELTSNTPKYLTSKLEYDYLEYDYIDVLNFYVLKKIVSSKILQNYYNLFFKNLTKSLKVKELHVKYNEHPLEILRKVNEDKNNLAVVSIPFLIENMSTNLDLIKNINLIIISNFRYIFFITTKRANIAGLSEIGGMRINIGEEYTDEYYLGNDILTNLNISYNLSNVQKTYYSVEKSFEKLINGEIDGMFFTDLYPSNILNSLIINDLQKNIVILPLSDVNYEIFKERHPYMDEVALDLNTLPKNYLPVKIKNLEYTKFRPDLLTYRYGDYLICNKNAEPRVTNGVVKAIVTNLDILNDSYFFYKNQWNYLSFPGIVDPIFIPVHIGAKLYFNKLTINTTESNDFCKFYVGKAKCNAEKIEEAKIISGML